MFIVAIFLAQLSQLPLLHEPVDNVADPLIRHVIAVLDFLPEGRHARQAFSVIERPAIDIIGHHSCNRLTQRGIIMKGVFRGCFVSW